MRRRLVIAVVLLAVGTAIGVLVWRRDHRPDYLTGVVEGEERVIRAEVSGRVLTVEFGEGDAVPANAVIATLDDRDIVARIDAKMQSLSVTDAEIARQEEQVATSDRTWQQDVKARQAELRNADSASALAEATYKREQTLIGTGASTQQLLDETRTARDQALSARDRANDMLARAQAEEGMVAVARHQLEVLRQQRELSERELTELRVTHDKSVIRAPGVPTRVETQFLWPGELAQPGTPVLALLDPRDQYVQIYIPVGELQRVHLGQRVAIELDSAPGTRVPGEISFIADRANFTPEKIETREDRIGQVYRAKVKILEDVEHFKPGTEGNIYLDAPPA
jgi:HlyD family secretion protein